jgi:hypothetical protein
MHVSADNCPDFDAFVFWSCVSRKERAQMRAIGVGSSPVPKNVTPSQFRIMVTDHMNASAYAKALRA